MSNISEVIRNVVIKFCKEYIISPYLCYTEHGQHALFYSMLSAEFKEKTFMFKGQKVCLIQKEYPTANNLGKSQRQHWDISIIKVPCEPLKDKYPSYDYLKLDSVVEFGMNEKDEHLGDDISRLVYNNPEKRETSNVENAFMVHLYRICEKEKFSGRDRTIREDLIEKKGNNAESIEATCERIQKILKEKLEDKHANRKLPLEIYFAIYIDTDVNNSGVWRITDRNGIEKVTGG